MNQEEIVIVSGLPRSGTSMMMRMLAAGGLPIVTDNIRRADDDNPQGYFEFEPVKSIARDTSWLPAVKGRAVKMISALLRHLPPEYRYRIIFMRREMAEILASQRQMLFRRGGATRDDDARMAALFARHLREIESWISQQPSIRVLYVSYNDIMRHPADQVAIVNRFVDDQLSAAAMIAVVDQALHRQQR